MKNTPHLFFYHISLLITHFNEWNTPQTKKLSGALLYYPFNHLGCICCTLVLVSRSVLTIILILNVQNWDKKHKNKLFSSLLSQYDLAVTLKWPYNNLGVTASWSPISIHMSPVYLGWDSLGVMQVLATSSEKSIYLLFCPFPSFQRKVT